MARRGERIGDAYVRIHADGARIPKDVKKELDTLDKPIERKGKELGSEFSKGVRRGINEDRKITNRSILNALEGTQGEAERRGRLIAGRLMSGIRSQLEKSEGRDIASAMTNLLVRGIQEGAIKNKKALGELLADEQRFTQLRARAIGDLTKAEAEAHAEALKLNKVFDLQRKKARELADAMGDLDVRFHAFRDRSNEVSDRVGRIFGRGARNDFINIIGATARGVSLISARITELGLRAGVVFAQGAEEAGSFLGGIRALGTTGVARLAPLLRLIVSPQGLAAMLVLLPVITGMVATLSSVVIGLGGALTAMASALVGGLVGGLGILLTLLVPVTAGIGGLVAAILLMDDATKKALRESIQPFVDQMKALADITADEAFKGIAQDAKALGQIFKDPAFESFARNVGIGLRQMREEFIRAFESDRFSDFFEKMGPKVREQLLSLTEISIQFGSGLGGVFLALQPAVDRFLSRLDGATARFAEWANSTRGQTALTDFFNLAESALASISRLTVSIGESFAVMFRSGAGQEGINLIDSLRGKFEEFTNFMRNNPEAVREFFADAREIAEQFGGVILSIIGLFRTLDTEASRNAASAALFILGKTIDGISIALKGLSLTPLALLLRFLFDINGTLHEVAGSFGSFLTTIGNALDQLPNKFGGSLADPLLQAGAALSQYSTELQRANETPIAPKYDPAGLLALNTDLEKTSTATSTVNSSVVEPKVNPQYVDSLSRSLDVIAGQVQAPKELLINAPQDPVLALIEKINFISLSLSAIKPANIQLRGVNTIGTAASKVQSLSNALAGIRAKTVTITAPTLNSIIGRLGFLNAVAVKGKKLVITDNTSTVLSNLGKIQSYTIKDKSFDINVGLKGPGVPYIEGLARGGVITKSGVNISDILADLAAPLNRMAAGGFANYAQRYGNNLIGESGREAIVPLDRPLGQVDPAVRELAAFAQGKFDYLLANAVGKAGINASGWTIVTPTENPAAVADEVLNRLTALSY